jgi:hypothetical protein
LRFVLGVRLCRVQKSLKAGAAIVAAVCGKYGHMFPVKGGCHMCFVDLDLLYEKLSTWRLHGDLVKAADLLHE